MSTSEGLRQHIERLQAELKAAEKQEQQEREERRKRVKPEIRFSFTPVTDKFDMSWDDTCVWFNLYAQVINQDELKAAGWSDEHIERTHNKGMRYLVNLKTAKIILRGGGGTVFIPDGTFCTRPEGVTTEEVDQETSRVYQSLAIFVLRCPKGGDVTEIVTSHRFRNK